MITDPSPSVFDDLARELKEGRLALFLGSGISKNPPSCLPLWYEFRDFLFDALRKRSGSKTSLSLTERIQRLRPEIVLQVLYSELGERGLRPLNVFLGGVPNAIHFLAARALARGNRVCTTNFDGLVEAACTSLGIPFRACASEPEIAGYGADNDLLKLHGSLADVVGNDKRATIIATLQQVKTGFSLTKSEAFRRCVAGRTVVFLGYSGLDEFDVVPALKSIQPFRAVWVNHVQECLPKGSSDAVDKFLAACFKESTKLDVDTVSFATHLHRLSFEQSEVHMQSIDNDTSDVSKFEALHVEGRLLEHAGEMNAAAQKYEQARRTAENAGDKRQLFLALDDLAHIAGVQGKIRDALLTYVQMGRVAENDSERGRAYFGQGKAHRVLGEYDAAIQKLTYAGAAFDACGEGNHAMSLQYDLGESYLLIGSLEKAEACFRTRVAYFGRKGDLERETWAQLGLARLEMVRGHLESAHASMTAINTEYANTLQEFSLGWLALWLADSKRLLGHFDEAERLYVEAEQMFNHEGETGGNASVEQGRAEIARAKGNYEAARTLYSQSLIVMRRCERKPLVAHALLGLAETARLEGLELPDYDAPLEHYREMKLVLGEIQCLTGQYLYSLSIGRVQDARIALNKLDEALDRYEAQFPIREALRQLFAQRQPSIHPLLFP